MTNKERLTTACPTCQVKAGDPCIDPKGDATPRPHKTRGPGQYDRHLQERIDRQTARSRASYGPLFQEIADAEVAPPTVAEVKLAERFTHARTAERSDFFDHAMNGLEWIRLQHIRRTIADYIGEWWAEELWGYAMRVFSSRGYYESFLADALSTAVEKRLRVVCLNDPARAKVARWKNENGVEIVFEHKGDYLHDTLVWPPLVLASVPVMTRAEWDALFPRVDREPDGRKFSELDDGGLHARVMAVVAAA